MLNDSLFKIVIDGSGLSEVDGQLEKGLDIIQGKTSDFALIVTGNALIMCSKKPYSDKLMALAEKCSSVLACRVSPKQKQEIVSLVREAVRK